MSPRRTPDLLAIMERRGSITAGQRGAGERFRELVYIANLDALQSLDLTRARGSGTNRPTVGPAGRIEDARAAVHKALLATGGLGQPGGSCLWQVVGLGMTIKAWGHANDRSNEAASGILVGALGVLEHHFNGR